MYYNIVLKKILPAWYIKTKGRKKFTVWIVGCNTGEVIYNFAIILSEFQRIHRNFNFQILATDNNEKFLNFSKKAIYPEEAIKDIPLRFKKRYFLKSKDPSKKLIRIVPELRSKVKFRKIESFENVGFREAMDIVKITRDEFLTVETIKVISKYINKNCCLILDSNQKLPYSPSLKLQKIYPSIFIKKI